MAKKEKDEPIVSQTISADDFGLMGNSPAPSSIPDFGSDPNFTSMVEKARAQMPSNTSRTELLQRSTTKYDPKSTEPDQDYVQPTTSRVNYGDRTVYTRNEGAAHLGGRARTIEFSQGHGGHGVRSNPSNFGGTSRGADSPSTSTGSSPSVTPPPSESPAAEAPVSRGRRSRGLGINMEGFGSTTGFARDRTESVGNDEPSTAPPTFTGRNVPGRPTPTGRTVPGRPGSGTASSAPQEEYSVTPSVAPP